MIKLEKKYGKGLNCKRSKVQRIKYKYSKIVSGLKMKFRVVLEVNWMRKDLKLIKYSESIIIRQFLARRVILRIFCLKLKSIFGMVKI